MSSWTVSLSGGAYHSSMASESDSLDIVHKVVFRHIGFFGACIRRTHVVSLFSWSSHLTLASGCLELHRRPEVEARGLGLQLISQSYWPYTNSGGTQVWNIALGGAERPSMRELEIRRKDMEVN